jgi:hypothetical protein
MAISMVSWMGARALGGGWVVDGKAIGFEGEEGLLEISTNDIRVELGACVVLDIHCD